MAEDADRTDGPVSGLAADGSAIPGGTDGTDSTDAGGGRAPAGAARPAVYTCYPDGPLLVRGDANLTDADGRPIPQRRRTVALCRCGKSGIAPFCDGTHKVIGFRAPGDLDPEPSAR